MKLLTNHLTLYFLSRMDRTGQRIQRINYSDQVRASHQNIPLSKVTPLYQALIAFSHVANSPNNCISFKLSPGLHQNQFNPQISGEIIVHIYLSGQCVVFDNLRVLHSREGFTHTFGSDHVDENGLSEKKPQLAESRHIHGAYIDWDEIESRINVLKLEKQDWFSRLGILFPCFFIVLDIEWSDVH